MTSKRTAAFRQQLRSLPPAVRRQAYKAYRQFKQDPYHPGLQFKHIRGDLYSVRIGLHFRALGKRSAEDEITWFWIGSHAEYDRLLKS
ncbi:MAG: hypothetical protein U0521_16715 [Anaerolineae bacterium]